MNFLKYTYTYDTNNNMIGWLYQQWNGSIWLNVQRKTYTYNGNNNMIEELWQNWDGSDWVNSAKYIYSYIPTDVKEFTGGVTAYSLSNNYPNPFNPSTMIKYQIPELSLTTLKVYGILGNEIEILINEEKPAGTYEVTWYAEQLPSGIYFYQLKAGSFVETKKMVLLK